MKNSIETKNFYLRPFADDEFELSLRLWTEIRSRCRKQRIWEREVLCD